MQPRHASTYFLLGVPLAFGGIIMASMASQVLATGRYVRAFVGIGNVDISPEMAAKLRLPVHEGIVITEVQPRSPADRAGLRREDIVTRVNDAPVRYGGDLRRVLRTLKPGDSVRLTVVSQGRTKSVRVRLGEATD